MKIKLLLLFFLLIGLYCQAQKEIYLIKRSNETHQRRIAKGSSLLVKTTSGKKYRGTLVRVKDYDIVLMRTDAIIDVEEIVSIKIIYKKGSVGVLPMPGGVLVYQTGNERRFKMKYWKLLIRNE